MRHIACFLIGAAGMLVIVGYAFVYRPVLVPDVALGIDPQCVEAMRRPPDLTWVAPFRSSGERPGTTVSYSQLQTLGGKRVRSAGVLHAEFEAVGLYRSPEHMTGASYRQGAAPWVDFSWLWPGEPIWLTRSPYISDRCVVIEGTVDVGRYAIGRVERLEVWSTPHRPFVPAPYPEPPPTAARETQRQARARLLDEVRARISPNASDPSAVDVLAPARERKAIIEAIADGAPEWLDAAVALWRDADAAALAALREGLQGAMWSNTIGVLQRVADGTLDLADVCTVNALPPVEGDWATATAIARIDMRIGSLSKAEHTDLAGPAERCTARLRREREAVLSRAAAGSEPWRPRPGR